MLDTNICVSLIRRRPEPLIQRIDRTPVGDIGISVVSLAELEYGVSKSTQPRRNREALQQFISPLEVAPFDRPATAAYGRIRAFLERKGQLIGSMDLMIAAHAVSLGVPLITSNLDEFRRVPGLRVNDWAGAR